MGTGWSAYSNGQARARPDQSYEHFGTFHQATNRYLVAHGGSDSAGFPRVLDASDFVAAYGRLPHHSSGNPLSRSKPASNDLGGNDPTRIAIRSDQWSDFDELDQLIRR